MLNIQIDPSKLRTEEPTGTSLILESSNELPEPEVDVDSVSFPELPTVRRLVVGGLLAGTIAFGQMTVDETVPSLSVNSTIRPTALRSTSTSNRYEQLRSRIVESGVPLLSDDEIRQEIRDRKGFQEE